MVQARLWARQVIAAALRLKRVKATDCWVLPPLPLDLPEIPEPPELDL